MIFICTFIHESELLGHSSNGRTVGLLYSWLEFGPGDWASYCNLSGNIFSKFFTEGAIIVYWIIVSIWSAAEWLAVRS
jgi:hypothetical protein